MTGDLGAGIAGRFPVDRGAPAFRGHAIPEGAEVARDPAEGVPALPEGATGGAAVRAPPEGEGPRTTGGATRADGASTLADGGSTAEGSALPVTVALPDVVAVVMLDALDALVVLVPGSTAPPCTGATAGADTSRPRSPATIHASVGTSIPARTHAT